MITTREINVNLNKSKLKLRHVTTKGIDAGVKVEPPKEPIKARGVSTTTLPDVADIVEKKRRDDIMAERKLAMKDEKKIVIVKVKVTKKTKEFSKINDFPTTPKEVVETFHSRASFDNIKVKPVQKKEEPKKEVEKKPWNKMNAKERKEHQAERARKKEEEK